MAATLRHISVPLEANPKPRRPSLFAGKRPKVYLSNGDDIALDDQTVLFAQELGSVDVAEGGCVRCFVKKAPLARETPLGVIGNIKAALTSPRAPRDEAGLYIVRKSGGMVEAVEFLGVTGAIFQGEDGAMIEATEDAFLAWDFATKLGEASRLLEQVNWGEGTATTVFGTTGLDSFQGQVGLGVMKVTAENLEAVTSRIAFLAPGSALEAAVAQALER